MVKFLKMVVLCIWFSFRWCVFLSQWEQVQPVSSAYSVGSWFVNQQTCWKCMLDGGNHSLSENAFSGLCFKVTVRYGWPMSTMVGEGRIITQPRQLARYVCRLRPNPSFAFFPVLYLKCLCCSGSRTTRDHVSGEQESPVRLCIGGPKLLWLPISLQFPSLFSLVQLCVL